MRPGRGMMPRHWEDVHPGLLRFISRGGMGWSTSREVWGDRPKPEGTQGAWKGSTEAEEVTVDLCGAS